MLCLKENTEELRGEMFVVWNFSDSKEFVRKEFESFIEAASRQIEFLGILF